MKNKTTDTITNRTVPEDVLWGPQTQLSLHHFNIGQHCFPHDFISALVTIKKCCAQINFTENQLSNEIYTAISSACDELLEGQYRDQFPLQIWQTGSGTQTNMNVNEVICTLANNYQNRSKKETIHPNDHVNMSQSSNDVIPSAMHIVVAQLTHDKLLQALEQLLNTLHDKQLEFKGQVSVGRTHLMDALPLPSGAVLSGYGEQLAQAKSAILDSLDGIYHLAIGGTAVGTGANAPANFGQKVSTCLANHYQLPFKTHHNLFAAVSGEDALLRYSSTLKQLASVLFKIANDFRLLGSGPDCGFNEWLLPANEPGSSIMPGKVNPTQCEALSMVCLQVFGNELTVSLAASHGQLQLNTYRPVIIHNVMESIELLSDAMISFATHCVSGLELNKKQIKNNMQNNLSAITLLTDKLGYDVAARIVNEAMTQDTSLAQAAESLGLYSEDKFTALLDEQLHE